MKIVVLAAASLGLLVLAGLQGASSQGSREVVQLDAERVAAAFRKGMPLLEQENYKVHASRREAAGQAEVHTKDTDIIYVLSGSATFVIGGTVEEAKSVEPEEVRGRSIASGQTRTIRAGELVVVPNGTPHWFKEVPAPMTYYVVKVRAAGDAR
jgi:glc operon protein GlcG